MKFRKIGIHDLDCNILDGKYIKDSNSNKKVRVVGYVECEDFNGNQVILEEKYLNYGNTIDDDILLRNFYIEGVNKMDKEELKKELEQIKITLAEMNSDLRKARDMIRDIVEWEPCIQAKIKNIEKNLK